MLVFYSNTKVQNQLHRLGDTGFQSLGRMNRTLTVILVLLLYPICFHFATKENDVMTSLSDDNQADIIEAFNATSKYLDDLLNIENPNFEGMVNQIYSPECLHFSYRGPRFGFTSIVMYF